MVDHSAIQTGPLAYLRVFLKGLVASPAVIRSVVLQRLIRLAVSPAAVASMVAVSPVEAVLVAATVAAAVDN